jgi:hypothetical protein
VASRVTQIARKVWTTVTSPVARVTQIVRKVWITPSSSSVNARVTLIVRKVWIRPDNDARLTTAWRDTITTAPAAGAATQVWTDSIVMVPDASGLLTQEWIDVIVGPGPTTPGAMTQIWHDAVVEYIPRPQKWVTWS